MAGDYTVGKAYLNVIPRIAPNATSALTGSATAMGATFGKGYTSAASSALGPGLAKMKGLIAGVLSVKLVADFTKACIDAGMNFDTAMSQVAATMGTTMEGLRTQTGEVDTAFGHFEGTLEDFAMYMGKNTAFSATEAAEALNYMALAGYDAQESMDMLPNVLSLAAAGSMDLAKASDMVTDTQTAFNISAERTTQMVDEMAKAASTGNTSVEQLGDAFLVVGGLAQELNGGMVTLKDGTTQSVDGVQELEIALTAMANAGVKGNEAGTHMRNMLLKLSSPTDAGVAAFESLGVSVFDASGKMRSLSDIFGDLSVAMENLTQEEKIQAISDIFNTRDIASAEALLQAVGQDWDEIGEAILDADGAAAQMAETQLDNLEGDVTLFNSALEGLQITLFHGVSPALRGLVQAATEGIGALEALFSGDSAFSQGLAETWAPAVQALQAAMQAAWPSIQAAGEAIVGALGSIVEFAVSMLAPTVEFLAPVFGRIVEIVMGAVSVIAPVIEGFFTMAQGYLVPIVQWIADTFGPVLEALFGVIADNLPLVGEAVAVHVGNAVAMAQELGANIAEYLGPTLDQFQAFVLESVVPAIQEFGAWIGENLIPALSDMWTWFDANILPMLADFATFVIEHVVPALVDMFEWVGEHVVPILEDLGAIIVDVVVPAISDIASWLSDTLGPVFESVFGWIQDNAVPIIDALASAIEDVLDWIGSLLDGIDAALDGIGSLFSQTPSGSWGGYDYYATGTFITRPTLLGANGIAGESGPEMLLPKSGGLMDDFADALSARIGGGGGGVTITGNSFTVREEADIEKIGRALVQQWERQQRSGRWHI